jgi:hypothetical protein
LLTEEGLPGHDCKEVMDGLYPSRPVLMDVPLTDPERKLFTVEAALSGTDDKKPDSQSPLLTTSHRLKPYHKVGLHNELNFGYWSRHYDMQRESG